MNYKRLNIVLGRGAYAVEKDWLTPVFPPVERKESPCDTPDIAFLCLPSDIAKTFEAYTKLFYPIQSSLEKNREMLFDPRGLWFTFGSPKDRMNVEEGSVASTS